MAVAIPTPRINNNDDFVRFSHIHCQPGSQVRKGDPIAEIETDKATFTVEAEEEGYVLGFVQPLGEMIPVGSVLAWLGGSPDEPIPAATNAGNGAVAAGEPTLKAAMLLARFGLSATDVPAAGDRLTAGEVLDYVQRRNLREPADGRSSRPQEPVPDIASGDSVPFTVTERGMLRTVLWHRDSAVPGYVEIEYETRAWEEYAEAFQQRHQLLMSPLLALMAYRLVELARENGKLNCTVVGDKLHRYHSVNLGFTLQSGSRLSLLSVRDAGRLGAREFVDALGVLMRQGMKDKLAPADTSGITITFSSMARWQVIRHMPVLPPYTSLIVAHAHGRNGVAALGGSYDHRVLTGGEVAAVLRALGVPPEGEQKI